jgi:hypothetical protein
LWLLAAPAVVAIWSGWVGLGQMAGFGVVHPLPGIADSFTLNSAITLPVGVEAYSAYALGAWLSSRGLDSAARTFAKRSALASLGLGLIGQVLYHLLTSWGYQRAPVGVVVFVACLPVLVLGAGATLHHLLRDTDHHQHGGTEHDTTGRREPAGQVHDASVEPLDGEGVDPAVLTAIAAPEAREFPPAPPPVVFPPAEPVPVPARAAGSSGKAGRKKAGKGPAPRKLLADYTAEARQLLADAEAGTDPSPSWCQRVTGCSAGTSVTLARLLRAEQTHHTHQGGDTDVANGGDGGGESAAGGSPTVEREREAA